MDRAGADGSLPCVHGAPMCSRVRTKLPNGLADDEFNDAPDLLAALKPDSNGAGADVIHHDGAGFVDSVSHFAHAHGADCRIPVEPGQRRIAGPGKFAPDKCCPVLQRCQAARVQASRQLVDRPNSSQDLH